VFLLSYHTADFIDSDRFHLFSDSAFIASIQNACFFFGHFINVSAVNLISKRLVVVQCMLIKDEIALVFTVGNTSEVRFIQLRLT
jgi:hypothetical protein